MSFNFLLPLNCVHAFSSSKFSTFFFNDDLRKYLIEYTHSPLQNLVHFIKFSERRFNDDLRRYFFGFSLKRKKFIIIIYLDFFNDKSQKFSNCFK